MEDQISGNDILIACQAIIIFTFFLSSFSKLRHMSLFQDAILDFNIFPSKWSRQLASLILFQEVTVVILLILQVMMGFILAIFLLLCFTIVMMHTVITNHNVRCGCFGSTNQRVSILSIVRNTTLIMISLLGYYLFLQNKIAILRIESVIMYGLIGIVLSVLLVNLEDIVHLYSHELNI